jgi:hypothetical protein
MEFGVVRVGIGPLDFGMEIHLHSVVVGHIFLAKDRLDFVELQTVEIRSNLMASIVEQRALEESNWTSNQMRGKF